MNEIYVIYIYSRHIKDNPLLKPLKKPIYVTEHIYVHNKKYHFFLKICQQKKYNCSTNNNTDYAIVQSTS